MTIAATSSFAVEEQSVGNDGQQSAVAERTPLTAYDKIPYKSYPLPQTHPDRLATIATLFGLRPAPVDCCRVLELGCASGGNVMPMAEQFPNSTFVGIDGSVRQIADGRQLLAQVGLENVELRHQDILDFSSSGERFDYILCHGVFSWVSDTVQRRILEICRECLAPDGVAYVSYNTYPGWHMRGMIRDIMRYRAKSFDTPHRQLAQARGLLAFLSNSVKTEENAYGILLKNELESIRQFDDSYLHHEHLEDVNEPLYFHQFAERAAEAGLQYLGEAEYGSMSLDNFPDPIKGMLQSVARDRIETEQYIDFLRNRAFRQTLLCHREASLDRRAQPQALLAMRVASSARSEGEIDLQSRDTVTFRRGGSVLTTTDPVVKAAMLHLQEVWPASIPFPELVSMARSTVAGRPVAVNTDILSPATERLAETLLRCFATSQVDLHVTVPRFVAAVSDRPITSPLARAQAAVSSHVTNRLHERVALDDFQRQLVGMLDGSRDHTVLLDALGEAVHRGELVIHHQKRRLMGEEVRGVIQDNLAQVLMTLAQQALLVG